MSAQGEFIVLSETIDQLQELFDDRFMQTYTNFNNFTEFIFSGAVFVHWGGVPIMGPREAFDRCVIGTGQFQSWEEMYQKACSDRQERK